MDTSPETSSSTPSASHHHDANPAPSRLMAWSAHAFTASGALWGLLSLIAISRQEWQTAFAWMTVALAVDAFDGMLARWGRVKEVTPHFDGTLLDNMLDFLNYVVVPAFLIHQAGLLPERFALVGAGGICLASAYQFCQIDAKTDDHFFKGFPSYWNVLAFYLFLGGLDPSVNLGILATFTLLVFVPLKWVYPSRMSRWRGFTIGATCVWGALCIAMLVQFPDPEPLLMYASLVYAVYYIAVSLWLAHLSPDSAARRPAPTA